VGLPDTRQTGADSCRWPAAHGWMVETRGLMVYCFLGMEVCKVLHGCTTSTEVVRRAIQHSQESLRIRRSALKDRKTTSLSLEDEAIIVAFRQQMLLPLGDCRMALQATIQHLARSSLHRCLHRHAISQLPEVKDGKSTRVQVQDLCDRRFHIDIAEVRLHGAA
jgi:hypothetical protein